MFENASPSAIDQSLARLLRQIRRTQAWRACCMITTVALLGIALSMAVDWFFSPLPLWGRWAIFLIWMVSVLASLRIALTPLFRAISPVKLARWLEGRHPEMQERISTALELQGQENGISLGLLEELRRAAESDAATVDAKLEVRSVSHHRRWTGPAAVLLGCFALVLLAWPEISLRLLVRAVAPFSDFGNAGAARFVVTPGHMELLEGDALNMEIRYQGEATDLALHSKWENGVSARETLSLQDGRYLYQLDPVIKSFRYSVRAGRDESDTYAVTVWPRPSLVDARLRVHSPDYLALEPISEPLDDQVSAVCGSMFRLTSQTNTAIESARLEISGKTVAEAQVSTASGTSQLLLEWTVEEPGLVEAKVMLRHRLGNEIEAHAFAMEMLVDQAPEVILLSPLQKELRLRPDEQLDLRYEVLEDFAIARVAVELDDKGKRQVALGQNLPLRVEGSKPPRFRGSVVLSIGDLKTRMGGKRDFRIRLRAQDAKPTDRSGPGIGYSDWLNIRIDEQAESLVRQELRQQHEGAMKEIDETIKQVREARERMDQHKEQVKKGELKPKEEKALQEAAEKLAEAQEKTHQLGQKMEESVHAPLATDVKQAAEKMQQSRESLENAPLQDQEAQREDKMQQARDQAEESIRKLEQVKQEMQKQNEKIQDLAKLQELAQKQQEVARQAEAQQENPNEKSTEEWQQQQQQVAQQLREELQQQPQALAEALKDQARQAEQLAKQAEEISQSQEQLKQQAEQAATAEKSQDPAQQEQIEKQTQQAIQQALAQEQAKIAAETGQQLEQAREQRSALADELPAAQAATENAKEQLAQAAPEAAAKAAKAAQESLEKASAQADDAAKQAEQSQAQADAAKESNDPNQAQGEEAAAAESSAPAEAANQAEMAAAAEALENLTERQAKVAEAAQALAEGNTAEALAQLQQAQAQSAQELAQAIAAAPQAQPSAPMQQAEQSSQQGSQQARQAAQQAQQGQQQQAAQQHAQAQQQFAQSAQALAQAAKEMSQAAAQAAQQQASAQQAQASPEALAEAFEQAAQASESKSPQQAAQQSQRAAQALQQAAQSAKSQMQGQSTTSPGTPSQAQGQPQPGQPGQPGEQASDMAGEAERPAEADPGVPPELAKLGISAADWEKIQNNLRADVGGNGATGIPEEYRELVKGYFQSMTTPPKKK